MNKSIEDELMKISSNNVFNVTLKDGRKLRVYKHFQGKHVVDYANCKDKILKSEIIKVN